MPITTSCVAAAEECGVQVTGLKSVTGHTLPQPVENAVLHRPLHRLEGAKVWGTIGVKFEQKAGGGFASRNQTSGDVSKYAQLLFGSNSYSATSVDLT